jgi:hypothetical protein
VRLHWGGYEYWGIPKAEDLGEQAQYVLDRNREDRLDGERLPDGDTVMTEWGDDALHTLEIYLREFGNTCLLAVLGELMAAGASVTRLDISADFASTIIDPVVVSMYARDYMPLRTCDFRDSRGKPMGGRTCYFGTRGADGGGVFVRFYEKGKEQGLPVDLLRYEVELCGDKAKDAARRLVEAPETWSPVGASILAGAIDFRDGYGALRGTPHAARDSQRALWWSSLLTRLATGVKLQREKRPDATLTSLREWAEKSWGRAAAMMQLWMGPWEFADWFARIIDAGAGRLTDRDRAILRDAQSCDVPI